MNDGNVGPLLVGLLLVLPGCLGPGPGAAADLHRTTQAGVESGVSGSAEFFVEDGGIRVVVHVEGLTPGEHGTHIHGGTDCGPSTGTDGTVTPGGAAGAHFNPTNAPHGQHAGDLGNLVVGMNGEGTLEVTTDQISLGPGDTDSVFGRAVVVHANRDDGTQPVGNSGGRTLCGLIGAA